MNWAPSSELRRFRGVVMQQVVYYCKFASPPHCSCAVTEQLQHLTFHQWLVRIKRSPVEVSPAVKQRKQTETLSRCRHQELVTLCSRVTRRPPRLHTFTLSSSWKQSLSSWPGRPLFSFSILWKVSMCQAIKRRSSILPLCHVWLVSSHHCCSVFWRASRASMEKGRRAVCAQPGHLAAQRGRGCRGR